MLIFFWHARANNFKVNNVILPEFELVRNFIPVQVICKFHKDPIKTKQTMPDKVEYGILQH